jgi:hypothetical protein
MRVRISPFCSSVIVRACCVQQVLRFLRECLEQLLDARDIARRLGERARELLDRRIAIQFERIKIGAMAAAFLLVAVQDLRLGLDLELAQLLFQARHRARQLAQVEIDRSQLLFESRARNADLAGGIEHLIEELGIHARHLGAIPRRHGLAPRRHRLRCREKLLRRNARRWRRKRRGRRCGRRLRGSWCSGRLYRCGQSRLGRYWGRRRQYRNQRRHDERCCDRHPFGDGHGCGREHLRFGWRGRDWLRSRGFGCGLRNQFGPIRIEKVCRRELLCRRGHFARRGRYLHRGLRKLAHDCRHLQFRYLKREIDNADVNCRGLRWRIGEQ